MFLIFRVILNLFLLNVFGSSTRKNANAWSFSNYLNFLKRSLLVLCNQNYKTNQLPVKSVCLYRSKIFLSNVVFLFRKILLFVWSKREVYRFRFEFVELLVSVLCHLFLNTNSNSCVQQSFQNDRARSFVLNLVCVFVN